MRFRHVSYGVESLWSDCLRHGGRCGGARGHRCRCRCARSSRHTQQRVRQRVHERHHAREARVRVFHEHRARRRENRMGVDTQRRAGLTRCRLLCARRKADDADPMLYLGRRRPSRQLHFERALQRIQTVRREPHVRHDDGRRRLWSDVLLALSCAPHLGSGRQRKLVGVGLHDDSARTAEAGHAKIHGVVLRFTTDPAFRSRRRPDRSHDPADDAGRGGGG